MEISDLLILFNLFILESLLSIDNAAVLAVMVRDLPSEQQPKALKYGILGAFVFRGLCLLIASWLIKILWLKIIGGLYLLWLVYKYFNLEETEDEPTLKVSKDTKYINKFWLTVILVEIMDIAFSIDNIFAAVAMTNKLWLVITGVCIGIVAMRFVAQKFVILMQKYPSLELSAYTVISILGVKLVLSGLCDYIPLLLPLKLIMSHHWFDVIFSSMMIVIFLIPIILRKLIK